MRSFAIDEPGSSVRELYATLHGGVSYIITFMSFPHHSSLNASLHSIDLLIVILRMKKIDFQCILGVFAQQPRALNKLSHYKLMNYDVKVVQLGFLLNFICFSPATTGTTTTRAPSTMEEITIDAGSHLSFKETRDEEK